MKKILFTLVFTLFYLPLCGFSQSDIHTPNKSEPAAFKLAKVYFLPDWSDKGMSFDGTDENPAPRSVRKRQVMTVLPDKPRLIPTAAA